MKFLQHINFMLSWFAYFATLKFRNFGKILDLRVTLILHY